MNKYEIIKDLVKESGIEKKEIAYIIDNFINKIKRYTEQGEQVEIRGLGTFYRAEKKPRKVHSPIAGKVLDVPAKTILGFRASKSTEKVVNIKGA